MSLKDTCDNALPGNWETVDVSELFALFIITLTLLLASFGEINLSRPIVREMIMVSLFVLFGSKYLKFKGNAARTEND